ncbi:hypothetical protein GWI33_015070 [Rhynchophorus ferrugineus]|uniref:Uncharacterized protein n=1 Tax=Rhynchophorus ferrugineus TaxID=354439 RepID=A0A834I0D9_RHYFE|nr:hypothetical protein GWI33_015070 [Rhynchophorus ferrugineus]
MTLTDNFSLRSWLVALRYSVEYYDDICESATASRTGGRTTMSIGEKGKIESGGDDGLYANVWECRGDSPARKLKTSLESVENSIYEENASLYESARSSCGSLTNTRNDNDKISDLTDLDDLQSGDSNNPSPIYENIPIYDDVAKEENIYENLPRALDDREFEEEIYSTIKCLDNVLDSVASSSDDEDDYASNLTEDFCERDNSSVNFELGDYCEIRSVRDEKFTESSSSFGEFLREDQIRTNKDQRFALYEEPEPISPQEIKNIPVPKRNPISVRPWQRFSFPTKTEKESAARPQSFPVFRQNSPEKVARSTYNIEDDEHFARNKRHEEDFEDCVSSLSGKDDLNLSFAREHRVSVIFDEKVEELDGLEVKESTIFGNDLILRLKENAITWMALLTEDVCDEMEIIMEDKLISAIFVSHPICDLKEIYYFSCGNIGLSIVDLFAIFDQCTRVSSVPLTEDVRVSHEEKRSGAVRFTQRTVPQRCQHVRGGEETAAKFVERARGKTVVAIR